MAYMIAGILLGSNCALLGIFYLCMAYWLWINWPKALSPKQREAMVKSFTRPEDEPYMAEVQTDIEEYERVEQHGLMFKITLGYGIILIAIGIVLIFASTAYPHSEPGGGSLFSLDY